MKIDIKGLEISACHGVLDFEKVKPQKFIFDVSLTVGFFTGDGLERTVNYAEVCALIERIARANCYGLIEKLATECAFAIYENFPKADGVTVTCRKPEAPVPQKFEDISVTVGLERVKAYLSLGSSTGERDKLLKRAVSLLDGVRGIKVEKVSAFLETEPYGGVAKNKFLNCAVGIETVLPPHALLDEIHRIEAECGRVRAKRWDDRTLDIDIIFYGDKRVCDETLIIPHPDWRNRDFVKIPLKSIAPHLID